MIMGFADGYRASWDAAVGKVTAHVFTDNTKAWSGDHCIDPHLVPGVIFCQPQNPGGRIPGIEDMAPTALELFGITPPPYMEGKSVLRTEGAAKSNGRRGMKRARSPLRSLVASASRAVRVSDHARRGQAHDRAGHRRHGSAVPGSALEFAAEPEPAPRSRAISSRSPPRFRRRAR